MAKSAVQSRKKKARKASKEAYASRFYKHAQPGKFVSKKQKAALKKQES